MSSDSSHTSSATSLSSSHKDTSPVSTLVTSSTAAPSPIAFVSEPLSWEELQHTLKHHVWSKLGRYEHVFRRYKQEGVALRNEWATVEERINHMCLGYPFFVGADGKKHTDPPPADDRRVVIVPNEYPYAVTPDIEHMLLFSSYEMSLAEMEEAVKEKLPHVRDYIIHLNPPELKSIKGVHHAHLFLRNT